MIAGFRRVDLLNEPDCHRVAVEFSVAGLDGGDDDEDGVQDPEDGEENEADQDQTKNGGDAAARHALLQTAFASNSVHRKRLTIRAGFSGLESQDISYRLLQPGHG